MQHRYFGDVGDYVTYGLLRRLCGLQEQPCLRLGVLWYLFPDESHNRDGKHLGYLRDARYRPCDEVLFDGLRAKLLEADGTSRSASRHLDQLGTDLLPADTIYYAEPLSFADLPPGEPRHRQRESWLAGALAKVREADLVFLDPDNGIECRSVGRLTRKGPKYVFWSEVAAFLQPRRSLVIYHHLNRSTSHSNQVKMLLDEFRRRFPQREALATHFRRGSGRAFFVLPSPPHSSLLRQRLHNFATSSWSAHLGAVEKPA